MRTGGSHPSCTKSKPIVKRRPGPMSPTRTEQEEDITPALSGGEHRVPQSVKRRKTCPKTGERAEGGR